MGRSDTNALRQVTDKRFSPENKPLSQRRLWECFTIVNSPPDGATRWLFLNFHRELPGRILMVKLGNISGQFLTLMLTFHRNRHLSVPMCLWFQLQWLLLQVNSCSCDSVSTNGNFFLWLRRSHSSWFVQVFLVVRRGVIIFKFFACQSWNWKPSF